MTRLFLEEAGYDVITLDLASGACATMLREQPDLVMVDLEMPGMSGDEVVRAARKDARLAGQRLVLYGSRVLSELERMAAACNADGAIRKSPDSRSVVEAVQRLLAQPTGGEPNALGPSDTVLFVDDEVRILRSLNRVFPRARFATSAAEALEVLDSPQQPSVVVTDIMMPGMSGIELYEQAAALAPTWAKRFVFLTAREFYAPQTPLFIREATPVLYKPVTMMELRHAIGAVGVQGS